jgi:hypothetical protein
MFIASQMPPLPANANPLRDPGVRQLLSAVQRAYARRPPIAATRQVMEARLATCQGDLPGIRDRALSFQPSPLRRTRPASIPAGIAAAATAGNEQAAPRVMHRCPPNSDDCKDRQAETRLAAAQQETDAYRRRLAKVIQRAVARDQDPAVKRPSKAQKASRAPSCAKPKQSRRKRPSKP